LESGADYATQSTHKVLSALSQSSMIHVNDPDFDAHSFRENFNMHTSTSPQYTMIASLDVGRRQAVMEGYRLLSRTLDLAAELRQEINATGVFRVLELEDLLSEEIRHDGVQLDPTKITIDISKSGLTVEECQKELFEKYHVQVEKSTFNTVSLLLTIGTTRAKVIRLLDALQRIAATKHAPRKLYRVPEITCSTELHFLPRDAYYCNGELMAMIDDDEQPNPELLGRVCADQIVPYPPGIPALVPGQVITLENLRFLLGLMKIHKRTDMHGVVFDGYLPCVRVVTQTEAKSLSRLPL
jgi:arginine decarboxylase